MGSNMKYVICVLTVSKLLSVCTALTYTIFEGTYSNKLIGNVARDSQLSAELTEEEFRTLRFSLSQPDSHPTNFSISEQTGDLFTEDLDREKFCAFETNCSVELEVVTLSSVYPVFKKIPVVLLVLDLNDYSPTFEENSVSLSISESLQVGKAVLIDGAVDKDSPEFSIKNYSIATPNVPFITRPTRKLDGSSSVQIIVIEELDRETKDGYQLIVVATDGGSPAKSGSIIVNITIIDVNDNSPVFTQGIYNKTVQEDIAINSTIIVVSANDLDIGLNGQVTYHLASLQSDNVQDLFSIDPTTGEIKNIERLVYSPGEPYKIYVEASDSGAGQPYTTQAIVYVHILDVNNNAPKIKLNLLTQNKYAKVSEFANPGAIVAMFSVTDDDVGWNGKTNCSIKSQVFNLVRVEATEYQVTVAETLDRETHDLYSVFITCEDIGTPPLVTNSTFNVTVIDENDNMPIFTKTTYREQMYENNNYRDVILTVSATDRDIDLNGEISYSLLGDAFMDFSIESESGIIRAGKAFDREEREVYEFHVLVKDSGSPALSSTATVVLILLDINDNLPKFRQEYYEFTIAENQPQESLVGQVIADDGDLGGNGFVTYSIAEEFEISVPFRLLPDGVLKTKTGLDREDTSRYDFTIIATDQGSPRKLNSSVDVRVFVTDINDNSPYLVKPQASGLVISLSFTTPINTPLYQVEALDDDEGVNAELIYRIEDRNDTHIFDINHSGEVVVARPMEESDVQLYTLEVAVFDNGNPQNFAKTVLYMDVTPKNSSSISPLDDNMHNQNLLIALTVVIITVVLAATIMVTICVIRRMDQKRREMFAADTSSDHSSDVEVVPGLLLDGQKDFSFSRPNNTVQLVPVISRTSLNKEYSINEKNDRPGPSKAYDESKDCQQSTTSESPDDQISPTLHRLASIRLHQALLQSHDKNWTNHNDSCHSQELFTGGKRAEDSHSQISGDTGTFDSGRGGSVSDGHSNMGVSHETDDLRILQLQNVVRQSGRRGTPPHQQKDILLPPRNMDHVRAKVYNNQSEPIISKPSNLSPREGNQSNSHIDQSEHSDSNSYSSSPNDTEGECSEPKRVKYSNLCPPPPPPPPPRPKAALGIQMGLSAYQSKNQLHHGENQNCSHSPKSQHADNFDYSHYQQHVPHHQMKHQQQQQQQQQQQHPHHYNPYHQDRYPRNPMQGHYMDDTQESIATTYDDDTNTTTSGSYTIDSQNPDEYPHELNIVKLKDMYV